MRSGNCVSASCIFGQWMWWCCFTVLTNGRSTKDTSRCTIGTWMFSITFQFLAPTERAWDRKLSSIWSRFCGRTFRLGYSPFHRGQGGNDSGPCVCIDYRPSAGYLGQKVIWVEVASLGIIDPCHSYQYKAGLLRVAGHLRVYGGQINISFDSNLGMQSYTFEEVRR